LLFGHDLWRLPEELLKHLNEIHTFIFLENDSLDLLFFDWVSVSAIIKPVTGSSLSVL
jgi:hypothetical protein